MARRSALWPSHPHASRAVGSGAAHPTYRTSRGAASAATPFLSPSRRDTAMYDLDEAINRLHQLDNEHLEDLVRQLDEALAGWHAGPLDEDTHNTVSFAGAARILLRQRRAATARHRAKSLIHDLLSASEISE